MRPLLLALTLLMSMLPAAAATEICVRPALCVVDGHYQDNEAGCAGGYADSYTGVYGLVSAGGGEACYGPQQHQESIGAYALLVGVWWVEGNMSQPERKCNTVVWLFTSGYILLDCPVGPPPNPGWGDVLP